MLSMTEAMFKMFLFKMTLANDRGYGRLSKDTPIASATWLLFCLIKM